MPPFDSPAIVPPQSPVDQMRLLYKTSELPVNTYTSGLTSPNSPAKSVPLRSKAVSFDHTVPEDPGELKQPSHMGVKDTLPAIPNKFEYVRTRMQSCDIISNNMEILNLERDEIEKEPTPYVFDKTFGVIPTETKSLWIQDETNMKSRYEEIRRHRKRSVQSASPCSPPVRNTISDNNTPDLPKTKSLQKLFQAVEEPSSLLS